AGADLLARTAQQTGARAARFSPSGQRLLPVSTGTVLVRDRGLVGSTTSRGDSAKANVFRLWDAADGRLLATLPRQVPDGFVPTFRPNGKQVLAAYRGDPAVYLLDATTGLERLVLRRPGPAGGEPSAAAVSPDGPHVVTASGDGRVGLWEASGGRLGKVLHGAGPPGRSVAFSGDGSRLLSVAGKVVRVWDVATQAPREVLKGNDEFTAAALSADGRHVLAGSRDHTAALWEVATGKMLALYRGHTGPITHVALSPDGLPLATASDAGGVRIWPIDLWPEVLRRRPRTLTSEELERYEVGKR